MIQSALEMEEDDTDDDEGDEVDEETELKNKLKAAGLLGTPEGETKKDK